jgi:hypothetical protein
VLEAGSGTKFQLLMFFNIVGPFLALTRNLGARHFATFTTLTCIIWLIRLKANPYDDSFMVVWYKTLDCEPTKNNSTPIGIYTNSIHYNTKWKLGKIEKEWNAMNFHFQTFPSIHLSDNDIDHLHSTFPHSNTNLETTLE